MLVCVCAYPSLNESSQVHLFGRRHECEAICALTVYICVYLCVCVSALRCSVYEAEVIRAYIVTHTHCDPSLSCMRSENFGFGVIYPRVVVNGVSLSVCVSACVYVHTCLVFVN